MSKKRIKKRQKQKEKLKKKEEEKNQQLTLNLDFFKKIIKQIGAFSPIIIVLILLAMYGSGLKIIQEIDPFFHASRAYHVKSFFPKGIYWDSAYYAHLGGRANPYPPLMHIYWALMWVITDIKTSHAIVVGTQLFLLVFSITYVTNRNFGTLAGIVAGISSLLFIPNTDMTFLPVPNPWLYAFALLSLDAYHRKKKFHFIFFSTLALYVHYYAIIVLFPTLFCFAIGKIFIKKEKISSFLLLFIPALIYSPHGILLFYYTQTGYYQSTDSWTFEGEDYFIWVEKDAVYWLIGLSSFGILYGLYNPKYREITILLMLFLIINSISWHYLRPRRTWQGFYCICSIFIGLTVKSMSMLTLNELKKTQNLKINLKTISDVFIPIAAFFSMILIASSAENLPDYSMPKRLHQLDNYESQLIDYYKNNGQKVPVTSYDDVVEVIQNYTEKNETIWLSEEIASSGSGKAFAETIVFLGERKVTGGGFGDQWRNKTADESIAPYQKINLFYVDNSSELNNIKPPNFEIVFQKQWNNKLVAVLINSSYSS